MSESDIQVEASLDGVQRTVEALSAIEQALRDLKQHPSRCPPARYRFEMLCIDLFRVTCGRRPELDAARTLVIGVEGGEIARRYIGKAAAERFPHLDEVDRAFAVGLAMGFMTEFLPRETRT